MRIQQQRPKGQDFVQRNLAGVRPRVHRRRQQRLPNPLPNRIPAPRARSSSKAYSASLTFVPTDFVRNGGFIAHRVVWILDGLSDRRRILPVRRWVGSYGSGRGKCLILRWFPYSNVRSRLG